MCQLLHTYQVRGYDFGRNREKPGYTGLIINEIRSET
nr:MAG TPA: Rad4 beta-hairpin domain 3 [Microviridae sp.]